MTIDWAATGAMLQGAGTLLGAAAVIVAAVIGGSTFNSWRRQQVAERKLFQAERILEATYKARRSLKEIRTEIFWPVEFKSVDEAMAENRKWQGIDDATRRRMQKYEAYRARLVAAEPVRDGLDECLPMARALFGENLELAIESLSNQFGRVTAAANSFLSDSDSDFMLSREIRLAMFEVLLQPGETDEVKNAIEKAVATIEAECLPVLRG